VERAELDVLLDKLRYLLSGAELCVFAGSLPRGVEPDFYAEAIREVHRRGVRAVLDTEGEALRRGVEAEPFLVSPNQREAEALVGQELEDEHDFLMALDTVAEHGARNVLISNDEGCYALVRAERQTRRLHAHATAVDAVSAVGAGDVLLAAFLAAPGDRPLDEALRGAIGAASASTLELGAGRFDTRVAARLAGLARVDELEAVQS
jgi:1-phosphofructokinase/tagatose 6-phosphate kinase